MHKKDFKSDPKLKVRLLCGMFLQLMLEGQNKRIDDLMERIRLQQEKLDKQNVRIRTLQSQVRKGHDQAQLRHAKPLYYYFRVIHVKICHYF